MKFLVINGPNLNFLGIREPNIYGAQTFVQLLRFIEAAAQAEDWDTARDELARAKKKWDHNRRFSASVADHEPMEELDAAFDEATVYARLEAQSECAAACVRLEVQLLAMADAHALRWWTFM